MKGVEEARKADALHYEGRNGTEINRDFGIVTDSWTREDCFKCLARFLFQAIIGISGIAGERISGNGLIFNLRGNAQADESSITRTVAIKSVCTPPYLF